MRILLDELGWEGLKDTRHRQLAINMYKLHNNLEENCYLRSKCTFI